MRLKNTAAHGCVHGCVHGSRGQLQAADASTLVKLMKPRVTRWDPGDATSGLRQKRRREAQPRSAPVFGVTDGAELHDRPGPVRGREHIPADDNHISAFVSTVHVGPLHTC